MKSVRKATKSIRKAMKSKPVWETFLYTRRGRRVKETTHIHNIINPYILIIHINPYKLYGLNLYKQYFRVYSLKSSYTLN